MIRRPALGAIVAAAMTVMIVAACGGDGVSSSGDRRRTVTIGFQGVLSGDDEQLGVNALYGVRTAIEEINADASLPFRVELVSSDDGGSPERAPAAARRLIDDSDAVAVIGPMLSDATEASEPFYSEAGLLSVSPSATAPALTDLGFTTFYRVVAPDSVQGRAAADYISTVLDAGKVYSVDDRSEYGIGLSTALEAELFSDGVDVVHGGVDPARDYTREAAEIIAEAPDVLFYSGQYADFALLNKALEDGGFTGTVMGGDATRDPDFVTRTGAAAAEGAYFSCACSDVDTDPAAKEFVASYKDVNGGALPGTYSGEAYDATWAVVDVLKRLGNNISRESVARAFRTVSWDGLTRKIEFEENGELKRSTVYLYKVQDGEITDLGRISDLIGS
ncbi:Extracellular ligand-binding receptor [Parafrankia sp. EAN1pec]|uniref:branched-chain amino acid ABC transporter substrate-binding protein n=1 Tax=Parafrankia sp. (strain EAN1pec) TaxID=298653 RepID=UPI000054523E|nr:Extracellular ligand-binding receptor [Frankia sp. EAN1pec]